MGLIFPSPRLSPGGGGKLHHVVIVFFLKKDLLQATGSSLSLGERGRERGLQGEACFC